MGHHSLFSAGSGHGNANIAAILTIRTMTTFAVGPDQNLTKMSAFQEHCHEFIVLVPA
jgi:hypothetical protein